MIRTRTKWAALGLGIVALSFQPGSVFANGLGVIDISVSGAAECGVENLLLDLGAYEGDYTEVTDPVQVTCSSSGLSWSLGFDEGLNYDGAKRRMSFDPGAGAEYLWYELLFVPTGLEVGNGTSHPASPVGGAGTLSVNLRARIGDGTDQGSTVAPGIYTDAVTMTLTF